MGTSCGVKRAIASAPASMMAGCGGWVNAQVMVQCRGGNEGRDEGLGIRDDAFEIWRRRGNQCGALRVGAEICRLVTTPSASRAGSLCR